MGPDLSGCGRPSVWMIREVHRIFDHHDQPVLGLNQLHRPGEDVFPQQGAGCTGNAAVTIVGPHLLYFVWPARDQNWLLSASPWDRIAYVQQGRWGKLSVPVFQRCWETIRQSSPDGRLPCAAQVHLPEVRASSRTRPRYVPLLYPPILGEAPGQKRESK